LLHKVTPTLAGEVQQSAKNFSLSRVDPVILHGDMFQSCPILLGQYRPLDSYLHQLDARAKIVPVTLVLILALLTDSSLFYLTILTFLVGSLLGSGVAPATLVKNFKPILILVLITVFYHIFFSGRETTVLIDLFGFEITSGALRTAGYYSLRLILFIAVAFLITLTSSPSDLADAFAKSLKPLQKIHMPVHDLALILFLAIRFIPVLYEEFATIRNAQMIRGVRFSGSLFNRLKKTVYIIIPVFVAAIQRADELALAIQARGYGSARDRTFYSRSHFGQKEWLFVFATSILIVATYLLTG
jgi:energy-coupling factor transport system permease protein